MAFYTICPKCGNKTLARLDSPIPNTYYGVDICYICDECGAELDVNKSDLYANENDD